MAVLFIDGFDKYGAPNSSVAWQMLIGEWTTASDHAGISPKLSSTGYALSLGQGTISKTLPGSFSRLIGGLRFSDGLGGSPGSSNGITLVNSNAPLVSVSVMGGTGFIQISRYSGNNSFPIETTTSISVKADSIHYLEWDITIGLSGAYFVYLDGILILSGNGDTSNGGGFSDANQFQIYGGNGGWTFDDLYVFDTSGSTNNAVLLTNPRIETQFPIADSQTQFTNNQAVLGKIIPTGSTLIGTGSMTLIQVTPAVNMTINSIQVGVTTPPYDNWTAVVYSDLAGAAHTLLAKSADTAGVISSPFSVPLLVPYAMTAGTPYWIGFMWKTDITINTSQQTGVSIYDSLQSGVHAVVAYGTPPSTAPTMIIGGGSYMYYGYCTSVNKNWVSENRNPPPLNDISFISSNTPGNEDLYNFPALTTHPTAIYTVAVKAYAKLTDTGNRSVDLRMKSVATDSGGTNTGIIPSTSYEWVESFFNTDPNTSTSWTESGLNNAVSGIKVAS